MDIALEVWSSDFDQLVATAVRADVLGLHAVYYGESPGGLNLECFASLAALAARTERVRLGPVIAGLLDDYRSLAALGKQAATVAVAARGRFDFRTGAGAARAWGRSWWAPVGVDYPAYDERLERLTRALSILPAYWRGEAVDFGGTATTVLGFDCPPIPTTVAATGPRASVLAATCADCWEISFATAEEIGVLRQRVGVPTRRLSLEIDGFVGSTARHAAAVERSLRHDRATEDIDRILQRSLRGTPDQVAEQLRALSACGVDQVVVALHDPHDPDALETLTQAAAALATGDG